MPAIQMTAAEIAATIAHSSLPTVVIEGGTDLVVLLPLEREFREIGLSVLPAGGRSVLLDVYEQLRQTDVIGRVAFVADLDLWAFSGIPPTYKSDRLVFTSGYSIENDAYCDGNFEALLSDEELERLYGERDSVIEWYALAVSRVTSGVDARLDYHPNELLGDPLLLSRLCSCEIGETYPDATRAKVK